MQNTGKARWENVYVFISSTFNDMHAERDYLVKQVFPELREWCERRRLRLVDIDLRWGVTEQDALYGKNVVKVCLDRIDDCRPFFLCFLGQRRGWVPGADEVSAATLAEFPGLSEVVGNASVTEMEVLHALLRPFHRAGGRYQPAEHSFFYLRNPAYLAALPADPPQLRRTYTNEGEGPEQKARDDRELARWRTEVVPQSGRPWHVYSAHWDAQATTPELHLPLECPSEEPANAARWRRQWAEAGVAVSGASVGPQALAQAEAFNAALTRGRLAGFQADGAPLRQVIVSELQAAIAARYPEHVEVRAEDDLERELDQQEAFLFASSEGFVEREGAFDDLDGYAADDEARTLVLSAPAGMGKSTLLARWIQRRRAGDAGSVFYRFIGQSDRSTTVADLLRFLLLELEAAGRTPETATVMQSAKGGHDEEVQVPFTVPADPDGVRQAWRQALDTLGGQGRVTVVLDALDQLETGLDDLGWLPWGLPPNVRLIVSLKHEGPAAEALLGRLRETGEAVVCEVRPFEDLDDRRRLVRAYLSQYLKELDERHLEALVRSPGAANPLYLRVVLSELRVFGAFANLEDKIRGDFGDAPISAFDGVLARLEGDPAYAPVEPQRAVPLLFGLLGHARHGLSPEELAALLVQSLGLDDTPDARQGAADTVHLFLRQVRPFLARRGGRYDFFYDSFRRAAAQRYAAPTTVARPAEAWHGMLARYFAGLPTWEEGAEGRAPVARKLRELPFHQAHGAMAEELVHTLTSFDFLQATLQALGPQALVEAYDLAALPALALGPRRDELRLIQGALRAAADSLAADPAQLATQLLGRLLGLEGAAVQRLLERARRWSDRPWLRPLLPCLSRPDEALLRTLSGHSRAVTTVAIAPDGRLAVSGARDAVVRVWDLETGRCLHELRGHEQDIRTVALTADGRRIVSLSDGEELRVWDLVSGECLHELTGADEEDWAGVAVTPDGRRVATVTHRGRLDLWDVERGACLRTIEGAPPLSWSLAITPDGTQAISAASRDDAGPPVVWDLERGERLRVLEGHTSSVLEVKVSADGRLVGASARDNTLRVWELASGTCLCALEGDSESADAFHFVGDGRTVVFASTDDTSRVWDVASGRCLRTLGGEFEPAYVLAVTPDGRRALSASGESLGLRVWDLASGACLGMMSGHAAGVRAIAVSPDSRRALSACQDGTLRLWDLARFGTARAVAPAVPVSAMAYAADSQLAVVGSQDGTLGVWDLESGACLRMLAGHTGGVSAVAVLRSGQVISASADKTLKVWDLASGVCLGTMGGHGSEVDLVALAPGERQAMSAARDGELRVWDVASGRCLHVLGGHTARVEDLALAPDGRIAVSASIDKTLRVWDLKRGRCLHTLEGHTDMVWTVAIAEGGLALSASADKTLRVWDLASGRCLNTLPATSDWHLPVAVLVRGGQAVARAEGNRLDVWDLASGQRLHALEGHTGGVICLAVTPDATRALSADTDGALRLWDLASGACLRAVQSEHDGWIARLLALPDGRCAISASTHRALRLWDLERLTCCAALTSDGALPELALSPDGRTLGASRGERAMFLRLENVAPGGEPPKQAGKPGLLRRLFGRGTPTA